MTLDAKIEAILFYKGEPVSKKELSRILEADLEEIDAALKVLRDRSVAGIVLIENGEEVSMGTHPHMSALIESLVKEDLERDIGKAGLETLTIVLYRGEASKREIDYIRGVNSGFIIRNLLIRGLIDRKEKKGERGFVYTPTIELQKYLGLSTLTDLPEYDEMNTELKAFLAVKDDEGKEIQGSTL